MILVVNNTKCTGSYIIGYGHILLFLKKSL